MKRGYKKPSFLIKVILEDYKYITFDKARTKHKCVRFNNINTNIMSLIDKAIKIMEHFPVKLSGNHILLVFCEESDINKELLERTFKLEVISYSFTYSVYYTRLN